MRREYNCEKGYKIEEMWECEWWQNLKTNEKINNHIRFNFFYEIPLSTDSLLEKIRDGNASTTLGNASTSLFSQLVMLQGKEMRTLYPMLLQRL